MNTPVSRSSRSGRQSLFFHDLATPISSHRGKFTTPSQATPVSSLWRENFGGTDPPPPPPPPLFTLEDRAEFSPESGNLDFVESPYKSEMKTPVLDSRSPLKSKSEASTSYAVRRQEMQQSPTSSSWWSPAKGSGDRDEKGKVSPVQPGALILLPPPREVARPELPRNSLPAGNFDEEEWVTVYGFSPGDTNLVLREFEKCGVILKHVLGPRNANWMHILYQSQSDAQKALKKNGIQINAVFIVGVKSVDPIQIQALDERINNQGFMPLPPPSFRSSETTLSRASSRPYYLHNNKNVDRSAGVIASPAKSVVSKIMDLMYGI